MYTVTVLWLPYILVTVCTDIVTVRIGIVYSKCTVATVHIGSSKQQAILKAIMFAIRT